MKNRQNLERTIVVQPKTGMRLRWQRSKETYLSIYHAKTVSEMVARIPWGWVSLLALVPMLLFTLAPLYQLLQDSISPPSDTMLDVGMMFYTYPYTVQTISVIAAVLGFLVILLYIAKTVQRRFPFRTVLKAHVPMLFFCVFILLMLVSTCINGFTDAVLFGDAYRNESLWTYLLYFLVYYFCCTCLFHKRHIAVLYGCFLAVSAIISAAVLVELYITSVPAFLQSVGLSAVFHQYNHYGYYLMLSILLSSGLCATTKRLWLRLCCAAVFVLNMVVLILNDTFGCYLAVFVALLFQCVLCSVIQKRFHVLSLLFLMGFVLISFVMSFCTDTIFINILSFFQDIGKVAGDADHAESAGTGRWLLWKNTISYIKEHPIFGGGIECIHDMLLETTDNNRPHNEYLQYTAFFGIPAGLVYLAGVVAVCVDGWKRRDKLDAFAVTAFVCAFGYLFSAFFGNTMYYTAPWLFMFMGILGRRDVE